MFSFESKEGTNSLLINRPVGTLSFFPVAAMLISTGLAMTELVLLWREVNARELEAKQREIVGKIRIDKGVH